MNRLSLVRVFVVDDEVVIAETLVTILKMNGFSAIAFSNPELAAEAARLDPPDLLISDVVMPQLSGVDLAILIRTIHPGCKILLLSGQAQTANLLRAARKVGHEFQLLAKPLHPKDLLLQIGRQDPNWSVLSSPK
jgi:DNA-binding NtrC family response regulator